MSVEPFDGTVTPSTQLIIAVFPLPRGAATNWWLEIEDNEEYDIEDLTEILDALPSVQRQIESMLELLR